MREDIWTTQEVAADLGVYPQTVTDIARAHRLVPKKIRLNGNAKGYDAGDREIIRAALTPRRRPRTVVA